MIDPLSAPPPGRLPVQDDPGEFDFQQSSRATHSEHSVPPGGVPRALREAAEAQGIDPVAELYNEALRYAQEGHLRLARERLQMLLCMAPDDGQARLLLAQVHVAGQRWSEALSALDEAAECGIEVPLSLRRAVEDHIHAEKVLAEEQRNASRAREQGEVKTLRLEVRRLRGENTAHVAQIANLEREVRKWATVTASVCVLVSVFILGSLIYRHFWAEPAPPAVAEAPVEGALEAGLVPEAVAEPTPEGAEPQPPRPPPIRVDPVVAAQQALSGSKALEGTRLEVRLHQDRLVLTGDVVSFKQRKLAERLLGGIEGISGVDATAVRLLARIQGTTHRVEKGDTLSHLAHIYYGDSRLTDPIVQANHIKDAVLRLEDVVVIPALRE
jgi:nucleoid-associated protein YgaU